MLSRPCNTQNTRQAHKENILSYVLCCCYGPTETRDVRLYLHAFITKCGHNRYGSNSGKQVHFRQDNEYSRDRQSQSIGKHNPVSKAREYPNKQAIVQTRSKPYPNKGEMSGVIHGRQ